MDAANAMVADTILVADPEPTVYPLRRLSAGDARPTPANSTHDASGPQDVCRICRGDGTPEEPLFYPCKCSGSIKYVHQDCLMEWLSHSQKKHCELCKTPFRFTKLYSPTMPKSLPPTVFVTHITKYLLRNILVWLRAALVVSVWLGWLPYLMRSTWSFLFWISDEGLGASSTMLTALRQNVTLYSDMVASRSDVKVCPSSPLFASSTAVSTVEKLAMGPTAQLVEFLNLTTSESLHLTLLRWFFGSQYKSASPVDAIDVAGVKAGAAIGSSPPTLLSEVGVLRNLTRYSVVNRTIISILEGQIITILVIVCFILIILVRDYVVQQQPEINMRAAFAGGEEPPPAPPPVVDDLRAEDVEHLRGPSDSDSETDAEMLPGERAERDGALLAGSSDEGVNALPPSPSLRRRLPQRDESASEGSTHPTDSQTDSSAWAAASEGSVLPAWSYQAAYGSLDAPGQSARPSTSADSRAAQNPDAREEKPTVQEYLRIHREAGGDPDKILEILRREGSEDRLMFWIDFTKARMPNRQLGGETEASSSLDNLSTKADYSRSERSDSERSVDGSWQSEAVEEPTSPTPNKGKGRATDAPDESLLLGSPLRPRANTDGPQRHEGGNPLGHNSWSFTDLPPNLTVDETPALSADASSAGHAGSSDYPTPPSSSQADNASPVARPTSADGPRRTDETELATLPINPDPRRTRSASPNAAAPPSDEWEDIPDFNEMQPRRGNIEPANGEPVRGQRQPVGIVARFADFMWRDVEAIDPQELVPPVHDHDHDHDHGFGDAVQDGDVPEEAERDGDVMAAAMAAGLDPEAMEDAAEEFEGIMELLGMRGPLIGLFQNAIFCAFLVSITIFLGVFFPYNFGRLAVWVMANPMRPVRILFSISKLLQDFALVVGGAVSGAVFYLLYAVAFTWQHMAGAKPSSTYLSSTVFSSWNMSVSASKRIVDSFLLEPSFMSASEVRDFSAISHEALLAVKGHIALAFATAGQAAVFVLGGDYPAKATAVVAFSMNAASIVWRGMQAAPAFLANPGSWVIDLDSLEVPSAINPELTYWDGMDRFWAILVGYIAFCLIAGLYLRRGSPFSSSQTGREWEASLIDGLNQASGVMKVILIIGIEMLVFPLYCGLLLDVALLPLFEETTLKSRMLFTVNYPLTSIFVHWFVGTGYMFHFALFVSMCRKIMRKGVLYFIRDPDDPEFHPVRDVLERSVATQLRKILFSAFVYGALVIVCLGGVVWGLAVAASNVLPIHYSSNEPVLEFPIDLLFYNFLMPLAVRFFKPSDGLHAMYTWWFRKCARMLRITWFLFGERRVDEEGILALAPDSSLHKLPWWKTLLLEYRPSGAVVPKTWQDTFEGGTAKPSQGITRDEMSLLDLKKLSLVRSKQLLEDGRFVRAPASDQVKVPKGRAVFLEVTPANTRADLIHTDLYSTNQYQFVYIPPHFRFRIFLFILFIWIFAAVTGVGITIVPLVFGRRMFKLLIPAHIRTNDIYAFSIGVYTLGSLAYAAFHTRSILGRVKTLATRIVRTLPDRNVWHKAATFARYAARLVFCYTVLLVLFPLLAAALTELYLLIPLHTYMYPGTLSSVASPPDGGPRHTVRVIQTWTLGLLYVKLVARSITTWHADSLLAAAVRAVLRRGWLHPDVAILTRAFVVPGLMLATAALAIPLLGVRVLFGLQPQPHVYRLAFPAMAAALGGLWTLWGLVGVFRSWRVRIRDEAYLIGERLHNFGVGAGPRARRAWRAGGGRL